ncbi:MAG: hypothetical protein JNM38_06310 [Acidobacteria bacterium]|nr:hypothetical protein [Acidobacteriota bacterium]
MRLTLLTCAEQPALTADDRLLADALARLGVEVRVSPWSALDIDAAGAACVLRSTWDYHIAFEPFVAWLDAIDRHGVRLVNSTALVRWNADKQYLRALEGAGIALPPTMWLEGVEPGAIAAALAATDWPRAVLKPRVSAAAHGTLVITPSAPVPDDALEPLRAHGALLQAFLPEIEHDGELSLLYFDGTFSHAVRKRPREGDFRVQHEFGGSEDAVEPLSIERAFAERVMAACPEVPVYARVDVVTTARGPVLMELELIEPCLYFAHHEGAAERCARAILARL